MTPEIISQVPNPDLEHPHSETFHLERNKTYIIKSDDLEVRLQRAKFDNSKNDIHLRIGAKSKISIASKRALDKSNWVPFKRWVDDPEEVTFLNITLNQKTNPYLYIDNDKLDIINSHLYNPEFKFASAIPFEIEVVDDPIGKLK
jgi:hypothetical protein